MAHPTMCSSTGCLGLGGLCMVLVICLAAAVPPALAEVYGAAAGIGLLNIPSQASLLANCSTSCGDINISYPFGIGPGCFRQGFELTCDQAAHPPSLLLGNNTSTTQITRFDDYSPNYVYVPAIGFNITKIPGVDTYNRTWQAPAKSVMLYEDNGLYVVGCDVDVYLFSHGTTDLAGACTSTCDSGIMENSTVERSCNGNNGCCMFWLQQDLEGFWLKLVYHESAIAKPQPDVKVILSWNYNYYTNDLYSSWVNSSNLEGAWLNIHITDQPSCESAKMNKSSYACNNDSNCMDVPYGRGYSCLCPNYRQGNPYVINGCNQDYDYSRFHKNCTRSCGDMVVPFPFGIEKDCFANDDFRLNCTPNNGLVLDRGYAQYRVKTLSLDDGLLVVSNMLNDSSSNNIERLVDSNYHGTNNEYLESVVDGIFDFSQEDEIRVKWVVANLTCQEAMKINATYACVSHNSGCKDVQRGTTRDGYRCKCSDGYHGNPYLPNGCTECSHGKVYDPAKQKCITSAKQHNIILGISIGVACCLGSIGIALCVIVLTRKWKKNIQRRIRRSYFKKNQGLLLEQLISDESTKKKQRYSPWRS